MFSAHVAVARAGAQLDHDETDVMTTDAETERETVIIETVTSTAPLVSPSSKFKKRAVKQNVLQRGRARQAVTTETEGALLTQGEEEDELGGTNKPLVSKQKASAVRKKRKPPKKAGGGTPAFLSGNDGDDRDDRGDGRRGRQRSGTKENRKKKSARDDVVVEVRFQDDCRVLSHQLSRAELVAKLRRSIETHVETCFNDMVTATAETGEDQTAAIIRGCALWNRVQHALVRGGVTAHQVADKILNKVKEKAKDATWEDVFSECIEDLKCDIASCVRTMFYENRTVSNVSSSSSSFSTLQRDARRAFKKFNRSKMGIFTDTLECAPYVDDAFAFYTHMQNSGDDREQLDTLNGVRATLSQNYGPFSLYSLNYTEPCHLHTHFTPDAGNKPSSNLFKQLQLVDPLKRANGLSGLLIDEDGAPLDTTSGARTRVPVFLLSEEGDTITQRVRMGGDTAESAQSPVFSCQKVKELVEYTGLPCSGAFISPLVTIVNFKEDATVCEVQEEDETTGRLLSVETVLLGRSATNDDRGVLSGGGVDNTPTSMGRHIAQQRHFRELAEAELRDAQADADALLSPVDMCVEHFLNQVLAPHTCPSGGLVGEDGICVECGAQNVETMRQSVFEAHVGYWVLFSSLYEGVQSSSDALSDAPVTLAVSHVRSIQSYLKRSLAQEPYKLAVFKEGRGERNVSFYPLPSQQDIYSNFKLLLSKRLT